MLKNLRLAPILALSLSLVYAREGACVDLPSLFNDSVEISFGSYPGGSNRAENFPLLLRISESDIPGFSYARAGSDGSEIRFGFINSEGRLQSEALPYEVEKWDVSGESTVWVKLPYLNNSSKLRLVMYWHAKAAADLPANDYREVWSDYVAVWHMGLASGDVVDSTGNGYDIVSAPLVSAVASPVGSGLKLSPSAAQPLRVVDWGAAFPCTITNFTFSAWYTADASASQGDFRFFDKKTSSGAAIDDPAGWLFDYAPDAPTTLNFIERDGRTNTVTGVSDFTTSWHYLTLSWNALLSSKQLKLYVDGNLLKKELDRVGAKALLAGDSQFSLLVPALAADEVRVCKLARSESWSKTEYAQVTNRSFCVFGKVHVDDDGDVLKMFHDRFEVVVSNLAAYTEAAVADFPLLVRLTPTSPEGFDYSLAGEDGKSIRFVYLDEENSLVTLLPHEIDVWNRSGESDVWVRLPKLAKGSTGRLYLLSNPRSDVTLPSVSAASVWSGMTTVWHLRREADSSGCVQSLFGLNTYAVASSAIAGSQANDLLAVEDPLVYSEDFDDVLSVPSAGCAVSTWVKLTSADVHGAYIFSDKSSVDSSLAGLTVRFSGGSTGDATAITVYPAATGCEEGLEFALGAALVTGSWERLDIVADPSGWVELFVNGVTAGRKAFTGAIDSAPFALDHEESAVPFPGVFDEVRFSSFADAPTVSEMLADVAQVRDATLVGFGDMYRDGLRFNSWVIEPSVSTPSWKADGEPGVFDCGETKYGDSDILYFLDLDTYERSETLPTECGRYQAIIGVEQGEDYTALIEAVDFVIEAGAGTGGIATPNDFAYRVTFTPTAYVTGSALAAEPFLVRVADGSPAGFYYRDLVFGATEEAFYSDVRFFDQNGRSLPYEIYYWNITDANGSLIWVKVDLTPETVVTMCWGQGANTILPENDPAAVWSGGATEEHKQAIRDLYLADYGSAVVSGTVEQDLSLQLQNRWTVEPAITPETRCATDPLPVVTNGRTYGGVAKVTYFNRATGELIESLPTTEVGEYRAIFKFAATARWSELVATVNFRVIAVSGSHDLGTGRDRVLLANDDLSVEGGEVEYQSYDDDEAGWGVPYWTHHEKGSETSVSDYDFTKLSIDYNLFAGTCHEYLDDDVRLWGLVNVRFGNLFNNARRFPSERGAAGLKSNQNYLPWNPSSKRMLSYLGYQVGEFHGYAGSFLMQNVCSDDNLFDYAQICSRLYTDGIGTVYFDVVNGFTDNLYGEDGRPNYAIVVEIATNMCDVARIPADPVRAPVDGAYPEGIWSVEDDDSHRLIDAYRYADWRRVDLHPIRFRGDTGSIAEDCVQLPVTNELVLAVDRGGSASDFYRVYVPVNISTNVRFRIRRTAIDRSQSLNPDAHAWILVDNIICSKPGGEVMISPYGWFDPTKKGKQYLGWEGAFTPKFPAPSDVVNAKVRAVASDGSELPSGAITAITMHYRWHYLEQTSTDWQYLDINPQTLESLTPMLLPSYPGDVDFWFEGSQNFGYYSYANYSGTKVGVPWYSESFSLVTNGWNGTTSEWSFRVRDGKSDLEEMKLFIREPELDYYGEPTGGWVERVLPMELVADHKWRGYYQTTNSFEGGVKFRFENRNLQSPDVAEWQWNTNGFSYVDAIRELPLSGKLTASGTNEVWGTVPCDAETGYLMFQVDDNGMGISIVHADYQNFNQWTDAVGERFVGTSRNDEGLPASGVSPVSKEYVRTWADEPDFEATNRLWQLDFNHGLAYEHYRPFSTADGKRDNGWILGKGELVYAGYRDPSTGTAIQMAGCGEGFVELSDQTIGIWPRGLEKISFNARISQPIDFEDFSYCSDNTRFANYTFLSRVAFDLESNRSFTGNASLSLAAYYRKGYGCYEARWEQIKGSLDTAGAVGPAASKGQRLALYRWNAAGNNKNMEKTLLCAITNGTSALNFDMPASTSLTGGNYLPMMISAYNVGTNTYVVAAVGQSSVKYNTSWSTSLKWSYVAYCDNSTRRHASGTYGVVSANSDGRFVRPEYSTKVVNWLNDMTTLFNPEKDGGKSKNEANKTMLAGAYSQVTSCKEDIVDGWWEFRYGAEIGRNIYFDESGVWGIKTGPIAQTVDVRAAKVSAPDEWRLLRSYSLSNYWGKVWVKDDFGSALPLHWRNEDCIFRIGTGGDLDSPRTDITLDNVVVSQWRGKNEILLYGDSYENADNPSECEDVLYADPAHYVYTSGWVKDGVLELSAKRTLTGRPASVRTPLFDGKSGRGQGLGTLSFSCRNVQTNVRIFVQVATNVSYNALRSRTMSIDDADWTTVKTFNWYDLSVTSTVTVPFGYRDVGAGAVARIILDPELVEDVEDTEDPTAFGSIEIVSVVTQDEPPIDKGCWWGWNLRTLGDYEDSELRMYLPDPGSRPSIGYSFALNNSTTANIKEEDAELYPRHMPFLQSPSFKSDVIGEVQFRARKYDLSRSSQAAEVTVYGITADKLMRDEWTEIHRFVISNTVYTSYSVKTDPNEKYCALRLAVTGVKGVVPEERGAKPVSGQTPVRVLLEEVVVSEAIRPRLAFRNVHAFRSDMTGTAVVPNTESSREQPLCGESWGVQCELYAVMLADEIDLTREPKVKLHWYEGTDVWGYEKWKGLPAAQSGWLSRATGTDALVYRSSYTASPNSVVPQSDRAPTVVQYMLEVFYTTVDAKTGRSSEVSALVSIPEGEWVCPEWYSPMDYNYNGSYGAGRNFACFNILDTLSPGWAWINEVNIFGEYTDYKNSDRNCQYVEIAAPAAIDLSGWTIRMISTSASQSEATTNVVATFGRNGLKGVKDKNITSNYVFHVIANPDNEKGDRSILNARDGSLDGVWSFDNVGDLVFNEDESLGYFLPVAVQLVRKSGVVEHEIVAGGTNFWNNVSDYDIERVVEFMNSVSSPDRYFSVGYDNYSALTSLSVYDGFGESADLWDRTLMRTPGRINVNQNINPDYPTPNGELVSVVLTLDQTAGNIWHSADGGTCFTNDVIRFFLNRGNLLGTNIIYKVDPWYEVGSVIENRGGTEKSHDVSGFNYTTRTLAVRIGQAASNNVVVTACAAIDGRLRRDYGLTDDNPYTPAVVRWLQEGVNSRGEPFANDDGEIRLAEFWALNAKTIGSMTLTEMYWLDMDPTVGDLIFQAGICTDPEVIPQELVPGYKGYSELTNLQMAVFMMISNKTDDVASPYYGSSWSPYVLRGVEPGTTSADYVPGGGQSWTSETFKITGILANGHTGEKCPEDWQCLRWFVFNDNSFYQNDIYDLGGNIVHRKYTTEVEVRDPLRSPLSPTYYDGWHDWLIEHGECPVFFSWSIDERLKPYEVEQLAPNNYYSP